ncbi:MAG: hypothetical protein HC895_05215 [Leptolyngbyaceae cyanobacterium SM1_3_5]|nr:hypothetical protein [Leptolyngbyaceae cyanobacterium SM1_3_5]
MLAAGAAIALSAEAIYRFMHELVAIVVNAVNLGALTAVAIAVAHSFWTPRRL